MDDHQYMRFIQAIFPIVPDYTARARIFKAAFFDQFSPTLIQGWTTYLPKQSCIIVFNDHYQPISAFPLSPRQNVVIKYPDLVVFDQASNSICLQFLGETQAENFANTVNFQQNKRIFCKGIQLCEKIAELHIGFGSTIGNF